jgi:inner membrane protein
VDTVTHALLGAALAQAAAPARSPLSPRERLLAGGLGAAFPDADFAAFPLDPLRFLADWHQGPTHSLVLLPLWAALIGAAFALALGRRAAFPQAALLAGLGLASHIAADAITAYGTAVFYPLSDLRVGLGIAFVIDPLFSAIVLAALLANCATGRRSAGAIGLAALGLYAAGLALLQQRALELARSAAHGAAFERIAAVAQPFSPFNWKLIGVARERYHEAYVNLAGHAPVPLPGILGEIARAYRPPAELAWRVRHRWGERPELHALAEERWNDPRLAPYRRFAAFPAVSRVDGGASGACVWFTDLRYDLPALPDTFRYGFCRQPGGAWELYRLRYFSTDSRVMLAS